MTAAEPAGGWTGFALAQYSAAVRAATVGFLPGPATELPEMACDQCMYKDSRFKALDEAFSRANAVIDDQAAQIVDLQAKLGLGTKSDGAREELIREIQKRDDIQRRNISFAERRVLQLIEKLREHEIPVPGEIYERWERPEPSDGTGLGAPASNA